MSSLEVLVPVCARQLVPCHFHRGHKAICHVSYGASVVECINPERLTLSVCCTTKDSLIEHVDIVAGITI